MSNYQLIILEGKSRCEYCRGRLSGNDIILGFHQFCRNEMLKNFLIKPKRYNKYRIYYRIASGLLFIIIMTFIDLFISWMIVTDYEIDFSGRSNIYSTTRLLESIFFLVLPYFTSCWDTMKTVSFIFLGNFFKNIAYQDSEYYWGQMHP